MLGIAGAGIPLASADDLPVAPITSSGYHPWVASGSAFRLGPAHGDLLRKLEIVNAASDAVISSELEDDRPTGSLVSPSFRIQRNFVTFLIGGGDYEGATCIDLVVDGKAVLSATGGRSDRLAPRTWNVSKLRGKFARVRIVDEASGDWGHINVDRIMQTNKPENMPPVKRPLYQEPLRPQFHFTARQWTVDHLNPGQRQEGWINDLNGLIFYEGEYHLFAQRWAKCWLHAVSRDLVHWTELKPAFWEESPESGVQSGTCVIDYDNTSGLGQKGRPAMVAFWSRFDNHSQCISYSLDHGRTWKLYEGNPIMDHRERDPKVFWYEPGKHWVMMMYGDGQYHILNSSDLLHWKDTGHPIPDSFECPDFFGLPIDGDPARKKWVLIQGNGNYSIGSFDGKQFTGESGRRPCDIGPNFYATQSWANTETGDGRRIQAAWMRGADFPDMPFSQMISFPCELKLKSTPEGLRVFREPIKELEGLHGEPKQWSKELAASETLLLSPSLEFAHIKAEISIPEGASLVFNLGGERVVLTANSIESAGAKGATAGQVREVEILLDRGSIEAFLNQGEVSLTRFALPKEHGLSLRAEGGSVQIRSLTLYPVKSIWSKR